MPCSPSLLIAFIAASACGGASREPSTVNAPTAPTAATPSAPTPASPHERCERLCTKLDDESHCRADYHVGPSTCVADCERTLSGPCQSEHNAFVECALTTKFVCSGPYSLDLAACEPRSKISIDCQMRGR